MYLNIVEKWIIESELIYENAKDGAKLSDSHYFHTGTCYYRYNRTFPKNLRWTYGMMCVEYYRRVVEVSTGIKFGRFLWHQCFLLRNAPKNEGNDGIMPFKAL